MLSRKLLLGVCLCACSLHLALADEAYAQQRPAHELTVEHRALPQSSAPAHIMMYRQLGNPNPYAYANSVSEVYNDGASLLDILPFPRHLVFAVVAAVKWVAAHASLLILGAVMMVGLCTLTPFCNITFSRFEDLESLPAEYYRSLDHVGRMLRDAIQKYEKKSD